MKDLVNCASEAITPEQRNLLSVAYKNVVGSRRNAWRVISSLETKDSNSYVINCREKVEGELKDLCTEVVVRFGSQFVCPERKLVVWSTVDLLTSEHLGTNPCSDMK